MAGRPVRRARLNAGATPYPIDDGVADALDSALRELRKTEAALVSAIETGSSENGRRFTIAERNKMFPWIDRIRQARQLLWDTSKADS